MLLVSSLLMSWTALVGRGSSLLCILILGKQLISCLLKWMGPYFFSAILKCLGWGCFESEAHILSFRFKPNEGVIVVGATNFAEALDR